VKPSNAENEGSPSSSAFIAESVFPAFKRIEEEEEMKPGKYPVRENTVFLSNRSTSPFNPSELRSILGDEYVSDDEMMYSGSESENDDNEILSEMNAPKKESFTPAISSKMEEAQIEFLSTVSKAIETMTQTGAAQRRPQSGSILSPRSGTFPVRTPMKSLGLDQSRQLMISTPSRAPLARKIEQSLLQAPIDKEKILGLIDDKLREMKVIEENVQDIIAHRKRRQDELLSFHHNTAMHIPTSITAGALNPVRNGLRPGHALSAAVADAMPAPSLLDTFEADHALHSVFGISDARLQDIPIPEQMRLRRVFEKTGAHMDAAEDHLLERSGYDTKISSMAVVRPSGSLEDQVYQFRVEASKAEKLRSVPFKSMGGSLTFLTEKISDAVLDDLLVDLAEELDSIFSDYAEKFIREV